MGLKHTCSWGPRPGGGLDLPGRGVGTVILSGQNFAAKFKYSKKVFRPSAETKNDKGGPLPRNGRFAVEGRFIQCKFGKTDREGGYL